MWRDLQEPNAARTSPNHMHDSSHAVKCKAATPGRVAKTLPRHSFACANEVLEINKNYAAANETALWQ